jgi:cystathionine gamma-lyase/homocysteine desulfhydrase
MDKITKALHIKVDINGADPVVTPIFQNSAFEASSPFFYTRKDNPNIKEIETVIATLEETPWCIACTTGMSAITMAISLLVPGDTLVVNKDIYGCSFKLFQKFTQRLNIQLIITDLSVEENISTLPKETRMVIFETPTNPFLKTIDIKKVSDKIKSQNKKALVVVDNTWGTPLYQQPLKHGADICLYSATKYFSGHSDVMGGFVLTNSAELHEELLDLRFYYGCILEPQSAWLLRRSMQTFEIRMKAHQETTLQIKKFLEQQPQVSKVYYPVVDGKQLTGYGTLLFFDLKKELVDKYILFRDSLTLFDSGTGMACVTSMVAQPFTGSHASMSDSEKTDMGLSKSLVRLSFGLENVEDLKNDLLNAFSKIG